MSNVQAIARAIDFVEANLKEPITVSDMANAASFSLYHFCRTFNAIAHHTPYDYLMRRRLAESAWELRRTDKKIIDIACDFQFNNPETFARAFRRVFDLQPNQLRKQAGVDRRRVMPRLTRAHLEQIAKGAYLKPALEEQPAFQIAGLMMLVKSDRAVIAELWELLARELETCVRPDFYAITYYPADWEDRGVLYLAGARIQTPDISSPALVVKTIPASRYARFIHKGSTQELPLTLDYIYHTWLPKSGARVSYARLIEHLGSDLENAERAESEREIYVPLEDSQERVSGA
jgi:AraC family transcriptional regulator